MYTVQIISIVIGAVLMIIGSINLFRGYKIDKLIPILIELNKNAKKKENVK